MYGVREKAMGSPMGGNEIEKEFDCEQAHKQGRQLGNLQQLVAAWVISAVMDGH